MSTSSVASFQQMQFSNNSNQNGHSPTSSNGSLDFVGPCGKRLQVISTKQDSRGPYKKMQCYFLPKVYRTPVPVDVMIVEDLQCGVQGQVIKIRN